LGLFWMSNVFMLGGPFGPLFGFAVMKIFGFIGTRWFSYTLIKLPSSLNKDRICNCFCGNKSIIFG